jgi:hypothetical protein
MLWKTEKESRNIIRAGCAFVAWSATSGVEMRRRDDDSGNGADYGPRMKCMRIDKLPSLPQGRTLQCVLTP